MISTAVSFYAVSHPEEEEAFRELDKRLNGCFAWGNQSTFPHLEVTPEEDEAFRNLERRCAVPAPDMC